jgi:uncharacterized membrane protein YozB (DUF420 family)
MPFLYVTSCVEPGNYEENCMPLDDSTLAGAIMLLSMNMFNVSDNDSVYRVSVTDDPNPILDLTSGAAFTFLRILYGILLVLLFAYSAYHLTKPYPTVVKMCLLCEGILSTTFQILRSFVSGYNFYNDNCTIDFCNLSRVSEVPFSVAGTIFTTATWLKIVSGRVLSSKQHFLIDSMTAFLAFSAMLTILLVVVLYAFAPWIGGIKITGSDTILTSVYINVVFTSLFAISISMAVYKIAQASKMSNKGGTALDTMRRMLRWVMLAFLGSCLLIFNDFYNAPEIGESGERMAIDQAFVFPLVLQLQLVAPMIASFG